MILLVSSANDEQTRRLSDALERRGAAFELFDYADYPSSASVNLYFGEIGYECAHTLTLPSGKHIDLDACDVVWWGRPDPFSIPTEVVLKTDRAFIQRECTEAVAGLWQTVEAFWINHPYADQRAEHKPYQLQVAKRVGLEIPETLITNDPELAQRFCNRGTSARTVYKSFLATEDIWRETRLVGEAEFEVLDAVQHAPVIFQDYVEASADIRVVVIDGQMFAAAFYNDESTYGCDYRLYLEHLEAQPLTVPTRVAEALQRLMQHLDLVYGAVDFRLSPAGQWVFLEINPCGQWLYVEDATGQQITDHLARVLAVKGKQIYS